MAERFVYEAFGRVPYVHPASTEFEWFAGFSVAQKRRSISSLHEAYLRRHPGRQVLEISSKGEVELGVQLSAFNLLLPIGGRSVPVECAYQAAKVFEKGGPHLDLLDATPCEAKRDARLRESGRLTGFSLFGEDWGLDPKGAFYNWSYIMALVANPDLAEQVMAYDAFTDIEFNPKRQVGCQAIAAATYVSLVRAGKIDEALRDCKTFLWTVYRSLG